MKGSVEPSKIDKKLLCMYLFNRRLQRGTKAIDFGFRLKPQSPKEKELLSLLYQGRGET